MNLSDFNSVANTIASAVYVGGQPANGQIEQTEHVRKMTINGLKLGANYDYDCIYSGLFVEFDDATTKTIKPCGDGKQPIGFIEYTVPMHVAKDSDGVVYNVDKKENFSGCVISTMTDETVWFKAAEDITIGQSVMVADGSAVKVATDGNVAIGVAMESASAKEMVKIMFKN